MSQSSDKQPFRGKVKYNEDGSREEIPVEKLSTFNKDATIAPATIDNSVEAFVSETQDNSGIPMIDANGQLDRYLVDVDEDNGGMVSRYEAEIKAASQAHIEKHASSKAVTLAMLQRLYESPAVGKTTDEVGFGLDGKMEEDARGWLRVPDDYKEWFIERTLTIAVMPVDCGIGTLSESELARGVSDGGHPIFPVVLSCMARSDTQGWDLYEFLDEEFSGEFAITLDQEMVRGDGMGRPMGLFPRVTMLDENGNKYQQEIAPPNVKNVQLVNVKPGQEAILNIGMLIALDLELEDALGSHEAAHTPAIKWYFSSQTGLNLATMKDDKGNFMLKQDTPAMKMIGVPSELAGHEIVYNEWMGDFYPGLTPIILGDIGKAYEVKIAPQLFIKRFNDADSDGTRVYGLGFYMAAGVNLKLARPTDGSEGELPLPYVGLVIDGHVEDPSQTVDVAMDTNEVAKAEERPAIVITQVSSRTSMNDADAANDKSVDSTLLAGELTITDNNPDNSTTSPHL